MKSSLVTILSLLVVIGLFVTVLVTRNRETPYAPLGTFAGCYSDKSNRLKLDEIGGVAVNGTSAGLYRIIEPVGGKHGFLVEAHGLLLAGGKDTPLRASRGNGGFLWPIDDKAVQVTFAPDVVLTLPKTPAALC